MIKSIQIKNFKCFEDITVKLNHANLLLGTNSGGKSSLIQALLLSEMSLDKSCNNNGKSLDIITNKYGLNLYSFNEILYEEAFDELFTITLNYSNEKCTIKFSPTDDNNVLSLNVDKNEYASDDLIYLSSDRNISNIQKNGNVNSINLGENNEYLGYIIEKGQKNLISIDKKRNHWDYKETKLFDIQMNNWLNFILPGNRVTAKSYSLDNNISILFGDKSTFHYTNVGYGISFVLPIIVAGLIAKKNSILIIENPELHLHPKAQSNIASFLSVVASSGVQVIIETHSDHIVNGFRKAVLSDEIQLNHRDMSINYFNVEKKCKVEEIVLNEKMEIDHWPEGFMDQEENDLLDIRKMRMRK
ncbi:DUF3696 domain-containing protein [Herbivorax sp. ANBcel31]|uniref:AAA family ATPase n=1 Tax=Herbivorax sp. ANBcel31 TaxID=3069754 RepID=UPI0027B6D4F6|nr:DUF3696 domain-containing protein [Herbivorax sp. ANBcel31]MDQ2087760.1 DUF3696 domain-containing protein [Herbivorax sp. ANBcel31]